MTTHVSTDLVIDAVRITRDIYEFNAKRLAERGHASAVGEMRRMVIMDMLLGDEHLCEMLAGRIYQLSSGTPHDKS